MEKKTYKCPICGEERSSIAALANCIAIHENNERKAEFAEKRANIEKLQNENNQLVKLIQDNCEKLRQLGVCATVTYSASNFRQNTKNINNEDDKKKTESLYEKDIKDFESFIKEILGGIV